MGLILPIAAKKRRGGARQVCGHARHPTLGDTAGAVSDDCSISSVVPFIVAAVAARAGLSPAELLSGSGIAPDAPPRADDHVPVERYLEVWRRVMARVGDDAFPLRVASAFTLEDHELFGFLAISCETLGQAYEKTAAYRALYSVGARWELTEDAQATRLVWYPWPGDVNDPGYRAAMDLSVADMSHSIRRLGAAQPMPREVKLARSAPSSTTAFVEHYGVEPRFRSQLYELVYSPDITGMKISSFNSRLRDYFEQGCRELSAKLGAETSVATRVRRHLMSAMDGGNSSVDEVARRLGMSSRSLQRHLADEQTSYNDLLTEVREEFAKRYLTRGSVSASEVAYLIGFSEPQAFFKAFKRWTGMTPREFQQSAA
jgi:AraC-like DNA-binding protein